jgi:hypothetical protein
MLNKRAVLRRGQRNGPATKQFSESPTRIEQNANRKGMARQSQIKQWLAEKLKEEQKPA